MRRNDFFKYILLNGSSQTYSELEPDTFPFVFKADGKRLRNYRIYGAEGGVGDLDSNTNKYIIPVTNRGINFFDEKYTDIPSGWTLKYYALYVGDGDFTLSTTCPKPSGTTATNLFLLPGNVTTGANTTANGAWLGTSRTATAVDGYVTIAYRNLNDADPRDYQTILSKGTEAVEYEPYSPPCNINIYLDEPLGADEYIDFREQKNDSGDIVLMPALTSIDGTNILSVGTTVQPAKIYMQGNIEEITPTLQTNIQNLQILRAVPSDVDDFTLDVMPIDTPNLQLNDVGGVESAE